MVVPDDAPVAPRFIQDVKENVKAGVRGEEAERKSKELVQQGNFSSSPCWNDETRFGRVTSSIFYVAR